MITRYLVFIQLTDWFIYPLGFLVGKILATQVIGMFAIVIAFDGMYLYSSELFPTVVRYW